MVLLSATSRRTLRSETISGNWKSFKKYEKCYLFHLKNSFHSSAISIFVLNFCPCKKTAWYESLDKFQNLWRHKLDNKQLQYTYCYVTRYLKKYRQQTLKIGQLIGYDIRNIFLEKSCTKCSGETSSRPKLSISLDQQSEVW